MKPHRQSNSDSKAKAAWQHPMPAVKSQMARLQLKILEETKTSDSPEYITNFLSYLILCIRLY
jgi:hypothetical protein